MTQDIGELVKRLFYQAEAARSIARVERACGDTQGAIDNEQLANDLGQAANALESLANELDIILAQRDYFKKALLAREPIESLTKPISEEEIEAAVRAYSGYVAHEKLPNSVRASFEDMGFALEAARKVRG